MSREEVFEVWAPVACPWSVWAKPVLFTQLRGQGAPPMLPHEIPWSGAAGLAAARTAVILDLPGDRSVWLGLQLAAAGFRPVPLFNTSEGPAAVVAVDDILLALEAGTPTLASAPLPDDAPPAFLLDADRMRERGAVLPGKYDNRWLVFPQDFPSADFLKRQRIAGVLLVQADSLRPQDDLAHVLLRWQEAGIPIQAASLARSLAAEPIVVTQPPRYRRLWYQFLAVLGLRRHGAGGFGAVVPEPSSSGGFG